MTQIDISQNKRNFENDTITSCPTRHVAITPGNTIYTPAVHVFVGVGGDVEIVDDRGVIIVYTLAAGSVAPIRATQVLAANTTATGLVGLY